MTKLRRILPLIPLIIAYGLVMAAISGSPVFGVICSGLVLPCAAAGSLIGGALFAALEPWL
jgi:hypothetical protein